MEAAEGRKAALCAEEHRLAGPRARAPTTARVALLESTRGRKTCAIAQSFPADFALPEA